MKLGLNQPVKGIITMCAPMTMRTLDLMFEGVLGYAKQYKQYEGKKDDEIEIEVDAIRQKVCHPYPTCRSLLRLSGRRSI